MARKVAAEKEVMVPGEDDSLATSKVSNLKYIINELYSLDKLDPNAVVAVVGVTGGGDLQVLLSEPQMSVGHAALLTFGLERLKDRVVAMTARDDDECEECGGDCA